MKDVVIIISGRGEGPVIGFMRGMLKSAVRASRELNYEQLIGVNHV